jgi:nucleoside-diphosphate-sugar epimerase
VLDRENLEREVRRLRISQVYLLSAMLSATGEQYPHRAWHLNMQSLLNTLEVARTEKIAKIFWPSSIAVFGPSAPKFNCPQDAVLQPKTVYGISKLAGEQWCNYYHERYGVDVRSLRYPGLISYLSAPGGGTTDYAVEIFHEAVKHRRYTCFLEADTILPMMFMPDAIRATLELMNAPAAKVKERGSYNISGMSFSPRMLSMEISKWIRPFTLDCNPDYRQSIAESWPCSLDDTKAKNDWQWQPEYNIENMTSHILEHLSVPGKMAL